MEKNLKIETLRFEKVDGWFCGLYIIEYLFLTFLRVVTEPTNMIFFIFFYEEKDSMKKFAGAYFMEAYKDELIGLGNGNQEL